MRLDGRSEAFRVGSQLLVFPTVIQGKCYAGSIRETDIPEEKRNLALAFAKVKEADGKVAVCKMLYKHKSIVVLEPLRLRLDAVCAAAFRVLVDGENVLV